jgi:hypothetical protein
VALPGERLARVGGLTEAELAAAEVFTLGDVSDEASSAPEAEPGSIEGLPDDGEPRRRRRRGGRGRGRGRGRADDLGEGVAEDASPAARAPLPPARVVVEEDEEIVPARRAPKTTPFGSVWDSQIGTPTAPAAASLAPLGDDEDFDEPEIPEYLIAEQRRGANRGGGGRGVRGGRSAYQSAMDRERFGRGGGGGGGGGGVGPRAGSRGINRYPDVSGRTRPAGPAREERGYGRQDRDAVPPPPRGSSEPWSDVPPELEALLRAQVAQKPTPGRQDRRPAGAAHAESTGSAGQPEGTSETEVPVTAERAATRTRAPRRPSGRTARVATADDRAAPEPAAAAAGGADDRATVAPETAPKRRPGRPRKVAAETGESAVAESGSVAASPTRAAPTPRAAAKPRTTRKSVPAGAPAIAGEAVGTAGPEAGAGDASAPTAPRRRTIRKAAPADPA